MKKPKDIKSFLPFGSDLRDLLSQAYIPEGDIRYLLQGKGIFVGNYKKEHTVPLCTQILITPSEFENLYNRHKSREDSSKHRSEVFELERDANIVEMIPKDFELSEIGKDKYGRYKVNGNPQFVVGDNKAVLDYTIHRRDLSKGFAAEENEYSGRVELSFDEKNKMKVKLVNGFTAEENLNINKKVISKIKSHIQKKNLLKTEHDKILFGSFSNEQRVKFLLSFIKENYSKIAKFEKLEDMEIRVDEKIEIPDESKLKWMEEKVDQLSVKGDLDGIELLENEDDFEFLKLISVQLKFRLQGEIGVGSCSINLGFDARRGDVRDDSEFDVDFSSLRLEGKSRSKKEKKIVEQKILKDLDDFKEEAFRKETKNA